MLAQVALLSSQPWPTAIAEQLHFSEWTLYGVFVENMIEAKARSFSSDDPLCLFYWDTTPLNRDSATKLFQQIKPTDVAAMISAKSNTPLEVKRAAFAQLKEGDDEPSLLQQMESLRTGKL